MFKAGDFLIGPYPPGSGKRRRFLVLTDEEREDGTVAWAYLSTSMSDATVVLNPGVHPEITKTCCVVYEQASVVLVEHLRLALTHGALEASGTLADALVRIVQEGVFESDATPIKVVDYCTDRL